VSRWARWGGPAASTVFTLILTPVLFTFGHGFHGFEKQWHLLLTKLHVLAPSEGVKDG